MKKQKRKQKGKMVKCTNAAASIIHQTSAAMTTQWNKGEKEAEEQGK